MIQSRANPRTNGHEFLISSVEFTAVVAEKNAHLFVLFLFLCGI